MNFDMKKTLEYFKSNKGRRVLIIIGIIGIILILLSEFLPASSNNNTKTPVFSSKQYTDDLQNQLASLVSGIEGAGTTNVMVTLENSGEYIYAIQENKNTDTTQDVQANSVTQKQQSDQIVQQYIIINDPNGGQKALLQTQTEPKLKGVVVVCEGGDNPVVIQRIIESVTVALDIPSNKVCVTKKISK
jgi:stage III sporulation protein AG